MGKPETVEEALKQYHDESLASIGVELAMVVKQIPYADFHKYEIDGETRILRMDRFFHLKMLVALDLLTSLSDSEKAAQMGATDPDGDKASENIEKLRHHTVYAPLQDRFLKTLQAFASENLDDWIDGTGRQALKTLAEVMQFDEKGRNRGRAAEQFLDRLKPKATRGGDGPQVNIFMPENHGAIAAEAAKMLKEVGFQPDPVVSAKRLNVPRYDDED